MSNNIPTLYQTKKPFHKRSDSDDELDVFEAARYFSGATENFIGTHKSASGEARNCSNTTQKYCMRPIGRMSLDMPTHRGDSIPLQAMMMENPMVITKEKKSKQPSSPGGKLAHFLNSLFHQTSSKKSKSKSKSTKDEDESPSGWRRKRRSSISHFRSGNSNPTTTTTTTTVVSDSKSPFSTSASYGFRTPPPNHIAHTPTKTSSYRDPKSYSGHKHPPNEITKTPINGNLNKIENFKIKSDFCDEKTSFGSGYVEKVKIFDEKHDEHHPHEYVSRKGIKEFKRFVEDEDGDSDSSSDLFELTNCDLGYYSSGLPVYETTRLDSIKRGAPISS